MKKKLLNLNKLEIENKKLKNNFFFNDNLYLKNKYILGKLFNNIYINKGNNFGIIKGDLLLNDLGFIGNIDYVGKDYSFVKFICFFNNKILVKNLRNNNKFILNGNGCGSSMYIKDISFGSDIIIGDVLVYYDYLYNLYYPVALVNNIIFNKGYKFIFVEAKPFVNFNFLDYVFILKKK